MKTNEIRDLDAASLTARIAELEEERFRLKFRSATEALESPLRLRSIRKDIARLKTIQRERAMGLTRGAAAPKAPAKKTAAVRKTAAKTASKASGR
jgi:large subunit ribosomal protein L29